MTIIDITRPIHPDMAQYPGNPAVRFNQTQTATDGNSALTEITLGSHTGTHIDAPAHIHAGAAGTGAYPLEQLIGPAEVIDLTHVTAVITAADLPATTAERVLIKTINSNSDPNVFDPTFVALDDSAAAELIRRGVKLVGLDALSIKKRGVKDQVHQLLLDANCIILEGIWLQKVTTGQYELICLPLPVDRDGAPVRAALRV